MSSFQPSVFNRSLPAAADLSAKQYFAVVENGSNKYAIAGANVLIAGFLQNVPLINEFCEVATIGGGSKGVAAATIAVKDLLETDSNGELIVSVGTPSNVVAIALEAAADGDIFAIQPVLFEVETP